MLLELATIVYGAVRVLFRRRASVVLENALLRQQVVALRRTAPKPRLRRRDRVIMAGLTKVVPAVLGAVLIVKPETVIRGHRSVGRLLWGLRSRGPVGRPPIDVETKELIRRMWKDNPLWGENRIAGELAKPGHRAAADRRAVPGRPTCRADSGQQWSTFLRNHLPETWACDWLTITTLSFKTLYAFWPSLISTVVRLSAST